MSGVATREAQKPILALAVLGVNVLAMSTFLGCMVGGYFEDYFSFVSSFIFGEGFQ